MNNNQFMIYYGKGACEKKLNSYETLVLDPDNYDNVSDFSSSTYAYLSIGEVNKDRYYYEKLKTNGNILHKNSNWDSYIIKFDKFWEELLIETVIPNIISSGYDGLMLDNIDAIVYYKTALKTDLSRFINSLKLYYPSLKIMVNRGFEIINELEVDAILLESTISTHDFETKKYHLYEQPVKFDIKKSIKCYSVDYWPKEDLDSINKIRCLAEEEGYIPLVTDIKLQEIH